MPGLKDQDPLAGADLSILDQSLESHQRRGSFRPQEHSFVRSCSPLP